MQMSKSEENQGFQKKPKTAKNERFTHCGKLGVHFLKKSDLETSNDKWVEEIINEKTRRLESEGWKLVKEKRAPPSWKSALSIKAIKKAKVTSSKRYTSKLIFPAHECNRSLRLLFLRHLFRPRPQKFHADEQLYPETCEEYLSYILSRQKHF